MFDVFFAMVAATASSVSDEGGSAAVTAAIDPPAVTAPVVDGTTEGTIATEGTLATEGTVPTATTDDTSTALTLLPTPTAPSSVIIGEGVSIGGNTLLEGVQEGGAQTAAVVPTPQPAPAIQPAPAAAGPVLNMAVVPGGLVAEPQVPTGKFTTAAEVKPIMNATKGNWVAVREYDGSDLLYVTHIWSWRCGIAAMAISVNGETMQNWPLPECHMKYTTPSAILEEDGLPYLKMKLGSVQTITIQLIYDDLTGDVVTFERGNILIP